MTALSVAQTILDYLDVLVWPFVVVALGGGAVVLFRPQIAELIRNIREARFPGGSISTQPPAQTVDDATRLAEGFRTTGAGETPSDAEPAQVNPPAAEGDEEKEQLRLDNQQLARDLTFEKIYRVIYGTQLMALQMLEAQRKKNPANPFLYEPDLQGFFREHERQAGLGKSYEDWKRFLQQVGLMGQLGSAYTITDLGREFLLYVHAGVLPPKPY